MIPSARQGMPPDAINVHACVVVLGDRGVAVTGESGSGKTSLALTLVERWRATGRFARLVGDDQVFVAARAGRLVAYAPQAIAGLAEIRGFGPVAVGHEPAAVIDLVVELAEGTARMPQASGRQIELSGVALPAVQLQARHTAVAGLAVEAIVASVLRPNDRQPAKRQNHDDLGLPSRIGQTT